MHWSRAVLTAAMEQRGRSSEGFQKGGSSRPVKEEIPVVESRKMEGPQAQRTPLTTQHLGSQGGRSLLQGQPQLVRSSRLAQVAEKLTKGNTLIE